MNVVTSSSFSLGHSINREVLLHSTRLMTHIIKVDIRDIRWRGVGSLNVVRSKVEYHNLVDFEMNHRVPHKENFFTS
jgi:hypothetical protein